MDPAGAHMSGRARPSMLRRVLPMAICSLPLLVLAGIAVVGWLT